MSEEDLVKGVGGMAGDSSPAGGSSTPPLFSTEIQDTMSKSLKKLIDINRLREFKNKLNAQSILKRWPDGAEAHNAMWGCRVRQVAEVRRSGRTA